MAATIMIGDRGTEGRVGEGDVLDGYGSVRIAEPQ